MVDEPMSNNALGSEGIINRSSPPLTEATSTAAAPMRMDGGSMGVLMRAHDWSATALGPRESWPQSLRTSISICLDCRFPILIWWGPDLVTLYNDDYAPMLGAKHPGALGRKGHEVWSELWPVVGPMLEQVMSTGVATQSRDLLLIMERNGYTEEAYFSFSYSPIRDESGGVGGVFCPVIETTEKVVGERRLRTLRNLAARSSGSRSVEAACQKVAEVLAQNLADVPFALIYQFEAGARRARLAAAAGVASGSDWAPATLSDNAIWPIAALAHGAIVELADLARGETAGAPPAGAWSTPPTQAVLLPIRLPAQPEPIGALVLGINSRRALDAEHRSFHELLAAQVTGAIADALASEQERQRAEALAELDRAKTTFFSNVSHEFRTPLTLILGALEEAGSAIGEGRTDDLGESVRQAHRNAIRLLRLVNNLLDFSRVAADRAEARFAATDLCELTVDLASSFRSACEKAGLALQVHCVPLGEDVFVDPEMWEKIVLNLLSNAFKFTLRGHISVRIERAEDGQSAVLRVADTGVGIPEVEIPRLFDRFHRIAGTKGRSFEGTGIGLALCDQLVRLHGGRIAVQSEMGRGSTFSVFIPLGRSHLMSEQIGAAPYRHVEPTAPNAYVAEALQWIPSDNEGATPASRPNAAKPGKVLIVDDNRDMREYLRRLLGDYWDVVVVPDGESALREALRTCPDLVITDVMMPGMDGFELLRRLKHSPQTAGIPVLMLSARAGEDAQVEGLQRGADDYLVKPFSAKELIARVQALVIRRQLRLVEESVNRRLAEVFRRAPVGLALLRGSDHVFEFANGTYREMIAGRDVVGLSMREALPELGGQGIYELLDGVYDSREAYVGRSRRVTLRESDGQLKDRWFDFVYQPISVAGGEGGIAVICFDVTELAEARKQAEAASRAKDEFLAMLGHELRNPLAPIVTALDLMKLREPGLLKTERALISRQVDHMVRLVDDLLDVSRVARGKIELLKRPIEISKIVAEAIETASPLIEARRHQLSVDRGDDELFVDGDAARLTQIVANLLTNAAKFTEKSGAIAIRIARAGTDVKVQVADSGAGIDATLLPHIFNLFVQGPQTGSRPKGGLGLGLTISRILAELHGGTLTATSKGPGTGSTFTLSLPLSETNAAPREASPSHGVHDGSAPLRNIDVLVVDDNRDAAASLALALQETGFVTRLAFDGPSALNAAKETLPDVALLDLGLPGMDGYEVAKGIRKLAGGKPVRVIAVTGYGQRADIERSRKAGFEHHLTKPISIDRLMDMLDAEHREQ
jgi:signal transduction histidine kinase